jgi:hypothetical protein
MTDFHASSTHRQEAELFGVQLVCNTSFLDKIIIVIVNTKNWIFIEKDFGRKISSTVLGESVLYYICTNNATEKSWASHGE